MKHILITWGAGYIGSHAVVAFQQAGYTPIIIDNFSNSSATSLIGIEKILGQKVPFYEVDLRDREALNRVFQKYSFDAVIHFAWLKAVGESTQKPLEYFDNNLSGSLVLFDVMKEQKVKQIIFSSSATVYQVNPETPISRGLEETDSTGNTTNPYGTSKYLLEIILQDLAKFAWFQVVILRYFNPVGAHVSGEIWEDPNGIPNNLLPYIMKVAYWQLASLWVFGNDYQTSDGTWVRDYIDVNDLIEGHLKAYEYLQDLETDEWMCEVFNLWTGTGTSVLEMIDISKNATGKEIAYHFSPRREGDVAMVFCNPKKANQILNWTAKTPLLESVKRSWKFANKSK